MLVCTAPWTTMNINVDGSVTPCCFWSASGNNGKPLGNLTTQSLREIWNGPAYQKLRQANLDDEPNHPCQSCLAKKLFATQKLTVHPLDAGEFQPGTRGAGNCEANYREFKAGRTMLRSWPTTLCISSTATCNIYCTFCNQFPLRLTKSVMSDSALRQVTQAAPYLCNLGWLGGETLLDKRFRTFVETLSPEQGAGLVLALGTNGLLVTTEVVEKLLTKFTEVRVTFSIDSFNKDKYERLRAGSNLDKVLKNFTDLQALQASGARVLVDIEAGLMKSTVGELTENLQAVVGLGPRPIFVYLSPFIVWPPHEMINCYTSFAQTRGWRDSLERASRFIASQASTPHAASFRSVQGTIAEVLAILEVMEHRYSSSHLLSVAVLPLPPERIAAVWPIAPWSLFQNGLFTGVAWVDGDCTNLINLEYCLLRDGVPLPGFRSVDTLSERPTPEGGAFFFCGAANRDDGRRFIGIVMAPAQGTDPRHDGCTYAVGLRPKAPLDGLKRAKQPMVIVLDQDQSSALGYLRIDGPGTFAIEVPADISPANLTAMIVEDELSDYMGSTDPAMITFDAEGRPMLTVAWASAGHP